MHLLLLNSEFSFFKATSLIKAKEPSLSYYFAIDEKDSYISQGNYHQVFRKRKSTCKFG